MVLSILTEYGFGNVKTAKNVKEAIEDAQKSRPELAILDVMLPDGNGFDLMEQLRKDNDYPILFLTARGEEDDKFKGFGLGADDYIVKPFLPKELLFRVVAILRRSYKDESPLLSLHGSQIDLSRAEVMKEKGLLSELAEKLNKTSEILQMQAKQRHGLGLLIVKQIIKGHNGTILIDHSEYGGFKVVLIIPK